MALLSPKNIGLKKLQKLLPNRTWQAIRGKMLELEVRGEVTFSGKHPSWTSEEIVILHQ